MDATLNQPIAAPKRSFLFWFAPIQAVCLFTVWSVLQGGQWLRAWILSALLFAMALPLFIGLEASLFAMMFFEPLRGLLRRAQYLIIDYSSQDPIHILTPIVTLVAFASLLRSRRFSIFRASPLASAVSLLGLVYILEIFNPLQSGLIVGLSAAMFIFVPLLWFYFGQTIDMRFITIALRVVVALGLVTSLYGVYQLIFGYPHFEQYWIDNTEFYEALAVGHVTRALATFSSAEEWGRYTELGAIAAFGFMAGAKRLGIRASWLACGVALSAFVLLTGQRAAVFGLIAGVVALILIGARSLPNAAARMALLLAPALLVVVLIKAPGQEEMWNNDSQQTVSTLLEHTQRGVLKPAEEESLQVRLTNWTNLVTNIIPARPLGGGLGAGSLSEWRFNKDFDLPPIDSSILQHAVACGIPGLLLFVWILARATTLAWRGARRARSEADDENRHSVIKRIVAAMMVALVLNSVFGLTFTLYSIAPLAWLLIGWTSAETIKQTEPAEPETESFII